MTEFQDDSEYIGKILNGKYSDQLKDAVKEKIVVCKAFDKAGSFVIPYISAWKEDSKNIWYEFAGKKLSTLLSCEPAKVASALMKNIIDRRAYRYVDVEEEIREEILTKQQINGHRTGLREEVKKKGAVEAVYQVSLEKRKIVWLKDWAVIESFPEDKINLSCGTLTDVTKEMDHKELLEQIGYFDELTKLPKRNILYRILEVNIGQLQRNHLENFVFLMMDIDHFKQINDTHGHQAGDHILACIAEVMASIKRKEDEIGRYAGEEFYAVSQGDIESGRKFAERIRKKIEQTNFSYEGQDIPVTISIGVAAAKNLKELNEEHLIMAADKRLYAAKQRGRNMVVWED